MKRSLNLTYPLMLLFVFAIIIPASGQISGKAKTSTGQVKHAEVTPKETKATRVGLSQNQQNILKLIKNKRQQKSIFQEFNKGHVQSKFNGTQEQYANHLLKQYKNCTSCNRVQKTFMIPLLEELENTPDHKIIQLLAKHEAKLSHLRTNSSKKEELSLLIYTFKEITKQALSSNTQNLKSIGRSIGRGIVTGFISGCIRGAYTGATAGTAVVPGVGTVTGAVSGCIASGAVGAVIGAIFGAFWGWSGS